MARTKVFRQMVKGSDGGWTYYVPEESVRASKDADGNDIGETYATVETVDGLSRSRQPRAVTVSPGAPLPEGAEDGQVVFERLDDDDLGDILDTLHTFQTRSEARADRKALQERIDGVGARLAKEAGDRAEADAGVRRDVQESLEAVRSASEAYARSEDSRTLAQSKAYTDSAVRGLADGLADREAVLKADILSSVDDTRNHRMEELEDRVGMLDSDTTARLGSIASAVSEVDDRLGAYRESNDGAVAELRRVVSALTGSSDWNDLNHDKRLDRLEDIVKAYNMSSTPLVDKGGQTLQGAVVGTVVFREE